MILSFSLPNHVVGTRRTALLGREANRVATENFTSELGSAHEAAMRGAEWSWREDENVVHKISALLAGLCILLYGKGSTDAVRKKDAFAGRVQLPFLETAAPEPHVARLTYVPHLDEWLVYRLDRKGTPVIILKHAGFDGLCLAVLSLVAADRKR